MKIPNLSNCVTLSITLWIAVAYLGAAGAYGGLPWAGQAAAAPQAPARGSASKPKAPPEAAMPFPVGEKLQYRVAWSTFSNAASVELIVQERRDLFGWQVWHFRAVMHTLSPVRTLFAIDDQFDSYTDRTSLESRSYEDYLSELGKNQRDAWHLIAPGQRPRAPGPSVVVMPGTRDALGVLFTLRGADWQRTPELRAPVYDGQNLYEMRANLESAADSVQVDEGNFRATRVGVRLFQNGTEDAAIHFTLWLANDAAKTPVQILAKLPFGSLKMLLTTPDPSHAEVR